MAVELGSIADFAEEGGDDDDTAEVEEDEYVTCMVDMGAVEVDV